MCTTVGTIPFLTDVDITKVGNNAIFCVNYTEKNGTHPEKTPVVTRGLPPGLGSVINVYQILMKRLPSVRLMASVSGVRKLL